CKIALEKGKILQKCRFKEAHECLVIESDLFRRPFQENRWLCKFSDPTCRSVVAFLQVVSRGILPLLVLSHGGAQTSRSVRQGEPFVIREPLKRLIVTWGWIEQHQDQESSLN